MKSFWMSAVVGFLGLVGGSVLANGMTGTNTGGSLPAITSFTAVPANIAKGQSSTLNWVVTGATSLSINQRVGTVTGTSKSVSPSATTTYTLTATNASGFTTATATVAVGAAPAISSFKAAPAYLAKGQSSTLSWAVQGATSLVIDQGVGTVTGTSKTVSPSATTTYMLAAINAFGSDSATTTVTVGSLPVITSFSAAPASIIKGQSSALSWAVQGATSLAISPSVGTVTGTSKTVAPSSTTTYTLTATNGVGSKTATITVMVGSLPTITSFTAVPASILKGKSSTLNWVVTGATSLAINQRVGTVTGTSTSVSPSATTTYTLTATNAFGSKTASATVAVGNVPAITSFIATPASVTPGQSSTLNWAVTGATSLSIAPGVGTVTGSSKKVSPTVATTYWLTATNAFGSSAAVGVRVTINPPAISSFQASPSTIGKGMTSALSWSTTGATSLSIDNGIGTVAGTSVNVKPTVTTVYKLTATNSAGSVTATTRVTFFPLVTLNSQLYYTEHCLFIIPTSKQVTWTGSDNYDSVFSTANIDNYVSTLKSAFPSNNDFFFVVVTANNLTPNNVPNVTDYRHLADGIGQSSIKGVGVPNICRYNIGGGTVIDGAFGVLDHEIGHNWGVFLGTEVANGHGHWYSNTTVGGQMAEFYSDDAFQTDKYISGDPAHGFTWTALDHIVDNETEVFSDQDLYLQGFNSTFPDMYVLSSPVYKPDHTVSYSSVNKYDQAWVEQKNGVRSPSYKTSDKKLRMGFVYVARDLAEVLTACAPIERSANHFVNAEQIDTTNFRFQAPFLVNTHFRASLDALLADLDGNSTPTLSITGSICLTSSNGSATVPFVAADPDKTTPVVSCVPASANCSISGNNVIITGLTTGAHFFTIKAEDSGGKKAFAHFVVER